MIQSKLPEVWQKRWQENHFSEPSLIQQKVFEPLQSQENLVGISPTGSGKTLAYLLPSLLQVQPGGGSQLLILASSQELGIQVTEVARLWAKDVGLNVQPLIGGANSKRQIEKLKEKPEVIVGTPGRVLEMIKQKKLKAHLLQTIILDEADQLLQPGAIEFVQGILKNTQDSVQYAFFSATAEVALPAIKKIVAQELTIIDVTNENPLNEEVFHYFLNIPKRQIVDTLRRLSHLVDFQGFVFFNQLSELGNAEEKLLFNYVPVASLASDQSKDVRKTALDRFKEKKVRQLLTTDLASRGLDIPNIPYVINVEVPMTKESYLHRSGRIGRMGASGTIVTIVQDHTLRDLKRMTKELAIPVKEIFLHGGELTLEKPLKEEYKEKKMATSVKEVEKKTKTINHPESKKKKKKKKNQKNKGARKSKSPLA